MATKQKKPFERSALRHLAEKRLNEPGLDGQPPRTALDTERLFHELQVHQIELALQNAELLQARDETEALLEKYTDLYDFAPIGYFSVDPDGAISSANLGGASLLGVERSRLLGRRFGQFIPGEARQLFSEFLGEVFARRGKRYCEVPLAVQGQRAQFVRIEAIASDSSPMCRVAVVDITDRKISEERILQLNNELEQRVNARTEELKSSNLALKESYRVLEASFKDLEIFSYAVAHDLRTPLRSMSGFSNILMEDYAGILDETGKALLNRIGDAAGRMGQLVDGILNLSRVTRAKLSRCKVDLSALANEVVQVLRELGPERRVDIDVAEGVTAYGDPHLLRQVLENLLDNAWKYTGHTPNPRIEFGTARIDGETVYFVRDNGVGFDMRHTARLFTPFERLHGLNEYEGIGIGLATVQRIVARHDGRIWPEGSPKHGSTFYFTLMPEAPRPARAPQI